MSQYLSFESPVPPPSSTDEGDWCVTFDRKWLPYVIGSLQALLDDSTYESEVSRATGEAASLIFAFQSGVCTVGLKIGTIMQYATATVPTDCLECDGSTHLRTDYPDLYAALASVYKTDADHFVTPDFRGRAPIGKGTGSGLTARSMNDAIGAETHTLTEAQIPSHTHPISTRNAGSSGSGISRITANQGINSTITTDATGGGGSHNNMQPSRAIGFCIVARVTA